MKKTIKFSIIIVLVLTHFEAFSNVIRTICNGVSGDASVWEGNEFYKKNDTVYIDHLIQLSDSLNLDFNTVIITKQGELCGQYPLTVPTGSKIINYGSICASKLTLQDTLLSYGIIHTGLFIISGLLGVVDGWVEVGPYNCFTRSSCTPIIIKLGFDTLFSNTEAQEYDWVKDNFSLAINSRRIPLNSQGYYKLRIKKFLTDEYSEYSDSLFFAPTILTKNISIHELKIKIFPNPINKHAILKLPDSGNYTFNITDMQGKKIYELRNFTGENAKINCEFIAPGCYYYILTTQKNQDTFTGKLIINE